ncbi:MAG: thioredoxin family protein [Pseudomonadota bacterium]
MVATESTMQALGSPMPNFSLPDVADDNRLVDSQQLTGKPVLVMFICNHCPYVIHIIEALSELSNEYQAQGCAIIAISSNDVETYPQDGPEKMQDFARQYRFVFPYCYDESQQVAKEFDAVCTPDFFLYDADHRLAYRGQFDASRPGNSVPVTGAELRQALQAVSAGQAVPEVQVASIGCNIKWKPSLQAG